MPTRNRRYRAVGGDLSDRVVPVFRHVEVSFSIHRDAFRGMKFSGDPLRIGIALSASGEGGEDVIPG